MFYARGTNPNNTLDTFSSEGTDNLDEARQIAKQLPHPEIVIDWCDEHTKIYYHFETVKSIKQQRRPAATSKEQK